MAASDPINPRSNERALAQAQRDLEQLKREKKDAIPPGLLAGQMSVDLAARYPGNLTLLYSCGEASGDLVDTSLYDATARDLAYHENTGAADWAAGHSASRQVVDHAAFGDGDDGTVKLNYAEGAPLTGQPAPAMGGAWFNGAISSGLADWAVADPGMQSFSVFFKPQTLGSGLTACIFGNRGWDSINSDKGWGLLYNHATNVVSFGGSQGSGGAGVSIVAPGACTVNSWYHAAVTWDGATYTLYLNGVAVGTAASAVAMNPFSGSGQLSVGKTVVSSGLNAEEVYYLGSVDQISVYSKCLSLAEVQNIFLAKGAGTQTSYVTVTIGSGAAGSGAGTIGSGAAPAHQVLASDGAAGTTFEYPRTRVYVNGA